MGIGLSGATAPPRIGGCAGKTKFLPAAESVDCVPPALQRILGGSPPVFFTQSRRQTARWRGAVGVCRHGNENGLILKRESS